MDTRARKPELDGTGSPRGAAILDAAGLDRLAAGLADQFATLYDSRPLDPRTTLSDHLLAFSFDGGLSRADEWLLETGRDEQLRRFREQFMKVIEGQLGNVVEALSGHRVVRYVASFDPATRITDCFFTLTAAAGSAGEQHRALLNWSEQVRRNSQQIRDRHRQSREANSRLRRVLGEQLDRANRS